MSGRLRISGGSLKGRYIQTQASKDLRPTTERVRESIFSSLDSRGLIQDAQVLDLYAGSGVLGFEAISRGASSAVFVEKNPRRAALIRASAKELTLAGISSVVQADVWKYFEKNASMSASVVFADPPYLDAKPLRLLELLLASNLLADELVIVFEGPTQYDESISSDLENTVDSSRYCLESYWQKSFGNTHVAYMMLAIENAKK